MLARVCFAILFFGISRAIDLNIDDTRMFFDKHVELHPNFANGVQNPSKMPPARLPMG